MARCVKCGEDVAEPAWAVYADPAFKNKPQTPFPLHPEHLADEVTPREWVSEADVGDRQVIQRADEGSDNPTVLVEGEPYQRYREVEAPE